MITYGTLMRQITDRFLAAGLEDAAFQAKELLLSTCRLTQSQFFLQKDEPQDGDFSDLMELAEQVAAGEPLQYVLGEWAFMGYPFSVGRGVLIPRPETEQLCELAAAALETVSQPVIFDLCAGSGCVGIAMALMRPDAAVYLFEKSEQALFYCYENVKRHALNNVFVIPCDILKKASADRMADAILTNPPYVETDVLPTLQPQVQKEPAMALDGGADGLLFYRAIHANWMRCLKTGGFFAAEHGEGQSAAVQEIFSPSLRSLQMHRDLSGFDRIVTGKRKEKP